MWKVNDPPLNLLEPKPPTTLSTAPSVTLIDSNEQLISSENPNTFVHDDATLTGSAIENYPGINTFKLDPCSIYILLGIVPVIFNTEFVYPVPLEDIETETVMKGEGSA
jgi:hypothetical protein